MEGLYKTPVLTAPQPWLLPREGKEAGTGRIAAVDICTTKHSMKSFNRHFPSLFNCLIVQVTFWRAVNENGSLS